MTRAEAKEWLKTNLGLEEPTEEQVTKYLDSIPKPTKDPKEEAELKRLKDIEKQFKALEGSKQTDAEKIADLNKRLSRATAESVLKASGMSEDDYKEFIDSLVTEDEETTRTLAESVGNAFKAKLEAQKTSLQSEFDERLKSYTPNPGGGAGGGDDKPDDVKNIEKLSFGTPTAESQKAIDYYK